MISDSSSSTRRIRRRTSSSGRMLIRGKTFLCRNATGRKMDREHRAAALPAIDRHRSAVVLDDLLHDGQAEAAATNASRSRAAEEWIEKTREVTGGDSRAAIRDGNGHAATLHLRADFDPLAFSAV